MNRRGRIFLKFFSWTKIQSRIKNLKGTDWLILLLVGVLLLIVAIPTGSRQENSGQTEYASVREEETGGKTESSDLEAELEEILSSMDGVGKVKVMITLKDDGERVEGVLVVAEGGGNASVCADILSAVQSLFSLEAHKITIVKMSVSEGAN
jgi:stage III sporulation protein AG